ncbi:type II secretion system protein [Candidatus Dojkabacteria bacterium]|uniref:Type II secretion system protein n=1 Tax=Candidatus Dojkabacteria bacterium TaxID=2099670 RepID=A0A955KZ46_9BACT|nr:type II secretion system protein [Candidatus Dojkabacteria bacterium]
MRKKYTAFTLVEIVLVVAVLGILATIAIVIINPAKAFADARNSQRTSDVSTVLNAVSNYTSRQGQSVDDLGTIATCPSVSVIGSSGVNLAGSLVDQYIGSIPVDPSSGNAADTGYRICKSASGRVTISAPSAENGESISVHN